MEAFEYNTNETVACSHCGRRYSVSFTALNRPIEVGRRCERCIEAWFTWDSDELDRQGDLIRG